MHQNETEQNEILIETVISSEEIYKGKVVHLRIDTVRLPNGREAKREIIQHAGAVCIVPIHEGKVLLIRQFRLAAGKVLLEIPAGMREPGEEPIVSAARELAEETGYRSANLRPLFSSYLAPGYSTELIYAFLATDLTPGETNMDADENVELVPIPLADIESRILAGEIQDSKTVAAVLFALRVL